MRLVAVALVVAAGTAHAEAPRDAPTEYEVDRDDAPLGRIEFGFDGGAAVPAWGAGARATWLEEPIVFGLPDATSIEPVRRRQSLAVGGALAVNSIVFDARFGVAHQIGDRLIGTGSTVKLDRFVPGDLRFGARIRVTGDDRNAAFVRGDLTLPTGDEGDFAGEPSWSLAWRLIGRLTLSQDIVIAAQLGLRLRGDEVIVADRLVGNEFLGALGVAVPLPIPSLPLALTIEVAGVVGDDVGAGKGPSPFEVRGGILILATPQWTLGARAGIGVTDEIGSPALRGALELAYQP